MRFSELNLPEANDPETRLRILTILGMLEVNYDSGMARQTWAEVQSLAGRQHHYLLATRAIGEQGIAAFLLGDISTAKKNVVKAWTVAKALDPGAHIRYASMYGAGLVEMHKYHEALGPLDEAIKVAEGTRDAAFPTIAVTAKVEALSELGQNNEALALAEEELRRVSAHHLAGHLYELYQTRAGVYERMGQWDRAVSDFALSAQYASQLSYWLCKGDVPLHAHIEPIPDSDIYGRLDIQILPRYLDPQLSELLTEGLRRLLAWR